MWHRVPIPQRETRDVVVPQIPSPLTPNPARQLLLTAQSCYDPATPCTMISMSRLNPSGPACLAAAVPTFTFLPPGTQVTPRLFSAPEPSSLLPLGQCELFSAVFPSPPHPSGSSPPGPHLPILRLFLVLEVPLLPLTPHLPLFFLRIFPVWLESHSLHVSESVSLWEEMT